jgi:precorrin-3B synthase
MSTGDGLLARLVPTEPIRIDTWMALCAASGLHGNGIMEVSQRGSLQIRGLSRTSARAFADTIADLGLAVETRPAILTSPLLGLGNHEHRDLRGLVADLRTELAANENARSVGPKVSVLIDGGGPLHLDAISADVRLRSYDDTRMYLSVGGNAASAAGLGWVDSQRAIEAIVEVLAKIARNSPQTRARDITAGAGLTALRTSLAGLLLDAPAPPRSAPADPLGTHDIQDGRVACGVELAFGHSDAASLARFAQTAGGCGADSIRPAPGRTLLAIGLNRRAADALVAAANADGFVVRRDDVRRYVIACAGAPACGSATLATRALAPAIAQAAAPYLDGSLTIHVSGCSKGCAHPTAAGLTLIGPDRIVVRGSASDTAHGTVSSENLIAGLRRLGTRREFSDARERSADAIARIGAKGVIEAIGGEPAHA